MNRIVYICGTGNVDEEIISELKNGNIPIAPKRMFPAIACPLIKGNAQIAGLKLIEKSDELLVVGEADVEVAHAKHFKIPIRYHTDGYERLYKAIFEGGK